MDSQNFEVKCHPDATDRLEKGCFEVQPLHQGAFHVDAVRDAQTHDRRNIQKYVWVVCGALVWAWVLLSDREGIDSFGQFYRLSLPAGGEVGFPTPADGEIDRCVGSSDWETYYNQPPWAPEHPYGAEAVFSLPLDSDTLYLFSRGVYQQGLVNIEQSSEASGTVDILVRVAYQYDEVLQRASVCQMERARGEHGVGIFTPQASTHYDPKDQLRFEVTLTLPAGGDGPLSVKNLETAMQNYGQNVAALRDSVSFGKISLASVNGRLSVQSVASEVSQFLLINGDIDGHFDATSSLVLSTLNGRITPTVNLLHRGAADAVKLTIHGEIDADVALASEYLTGGEFDVNVESTHGSVALRYTESPLDSVLTCHAKTVVNSIEVELHSAFEGTYSLQSVLGARNIEQRQVEDPAAKGRRRVISQNTLTRRVDGTVKWVDRDGNSSVNAGSILLETITASTTLII